MVGLAIAIRRNHTTPLIDCPFTLSMFATGTRAWHVAAHVCSPPPPSHHHRRRRHCHHHHQKQELIARSARSATATQLVACTHVISTSIVAVRTDLCGRGVCKRKGLARPSWRAHTGGFRSFTEEDAEEECRSVCSFVRSFCSCWRRASAMPCHHGWLLWSSAR